MASKRKNTKSRPVNARSLKTVRELTQKARVELSKIIGRTKRGTISAAKLELRLRELRTKLKKILMHEFRI
jgi:hypothetical protein